jgi:TetR/AcrR family tetracycline transcriptional repressor
VGLAPRDREDVALNADDETARNVQRVAGRLVSRQEIVEAALAIAHRVGVEGVTMRTLAEELGISVATAYYHVADKAELLRLMAEASLAEVRCPSPEAPWDARLVTLSQDVRRASARYPGLFLAVPGVTERSEVRRLGRCTMNMLRDAGLHAEDLEAALVSVATYIWGQLLLDALGREAVAPEPGATSPRSGPSAAETAAAFETGFDVLLDGIRHRAR